MDLRHRDIRYFLLSELIQPSTFISITNGNEARINDFIPPKIIQKCFQNSGRFEDYVYDYNKYLFSAGKFNSLASMIKDYLEFKKDVIFFCTDAELQLGYLEVLAEIISRRYGVYVLNPNELFQYHTQVPNISEYRVNVQGKLNLEQDLCNENQQVQQKSYNDEPNSSNDNHLEVQNPQYPQIPDIVYTRYGKLQSI